MIFRKIKTKKLTISYILTYTNKDITITHPSAIRHTQQLPTTLMFDAQLIQTDVGLERCASCCCWHNEGGAGIDTTSQRMRAPTYEKTSTTAGTCQCHWGLHMCMTISMCMCVSSCCCDFL